MKELVFKQNVAVNGTSSPILSVPQFMDPRPSAALDVNEPSASDDKTQDLSSSPGNNMEVVLKEGDHQIPGKHASVEDGSDQTSQSWRPTKCPKLDHSNKEEQVSHVPLRKARVSIRARSEAPLVCIYTKVLLYYLYLQRLRQICGK